MELDHGHEPSQLEQRRDGPVRDSGRGLGVQHEAHRAEPVQEAERGLCERERGPSLSHAEMNLHETQSVDWESSMEHA